LNPTIHCEKQNLKGRNKMKIFWGSMMLAVLFMFGLAAFAAEVKSDTAPTTSSVRNVSPATGTTTTTLTTTSKPGKKGGVDSVTSATTPKKKS
jgi:hypothetical protein